MWNKISKVLLGIIIFCAIVYGVYLILPGQYKNPITSWFQTSTNEDSKAAIDELKGFSVSKFDKNIPDTVTFDRMMTSATANPAWTVESSTVDKDTGNGSMEIHADGYKCTIEMDNANADNTKTMTDVHVQLIFRVTMEQHKVKEIKFDTINAGQETYQKNSQDAASKQYFTGTLESMCANIK